MAGIAGGRAESSRAPRLPPSRSIKAIERPCAAHVSAKVVGPTWAPRFRRGGRALLGGARCGGCGSRPRRAAAHVAHASATGARAARGCALRGGRARAAKSCGPRGPRFTRRGASRWQACRVISGTALLRPDRSSYRATPRRSRQREVWEPTWAHASRGGSARYRGMRGLLAGMGRQELGPTWAHASGGGAAGCGRLTPLFSDEHWTPRRRSIERLLRAARRQDDAWE
jgi:hypothetical protein